MSAPGIKRGLPRQLARELLEAYKQQAGPLVDKREPDRYRQWAEELVRKSEQALGDKQ
jgi:hypothetical protein